MSESRSPVVEDAELERRAWETLHHFITRHAESHVEANDIAAALARISGKPDTRRVNWLAAAMRERPQ